MKSPPPRCTTPWMWPTRPLSDSTFVRPDLCPSTGRTPYRSRTGAPCASRVRRRAHPSEAGAAVGLPHRFGAAAPPCRPAQCAAVAPRLPRLARMWSSATRVPVVHNRGRIGSSWTSQPPWMCQGSSPSGVVTLTAPGTRDELRPRTSSALLLGAAPALVAVRSGWSLGSVVPTGRRFRAEGATADRGAPDVAQRLLTDSPDQKPFLGRCVWALDPP